MKTIEQELRELIKSRYKSVREFSIQIGIPNSTIDSVLSRGVQKANISSLMKICDALRIDCESLYYGRILPKRDLLDNMLLSEAELHHMERYRSLSEEGKQFVDQILEREYSRR